MKQRKIGKMLGIGLVVLAVVGTMGIATWGISILGAWHTDVVSFNSEPVTLDLDFQYKNINTSMGANNASSSMVVLNKDGATAVLVSINETREDVLTDNCTDYEEDCTLSYSYGGAAIEDGDTITLESGENILAASISCKKFSCAQHVSASIGLSPA